LVLYEPYDVGPRTVLLKAGKIELVASEESTTHVLAVVDEAHHVFTDGLGIKAFEAHAHPKARHVLLSDVSQASGAEPSYPHGLIEVFLTEVVRSSARVVAGAKAFQLSGQDTTVAHHTSNGPPLKPFLFQMKESSSPTTQYAEHLITALTHVVNFLGSLPLHNRVAIIGPDADFMQSLQPELEGALASAFPLRRLRLMRDEPQRMLQPGQDAAEDGAEWLVYTEEANTLGLEYLIVIGVGLDVAIDHHDASRRSLLYRAMTRAQMMVVLVQHHQENGWL
jgi:hypothetical protein